MIQTVLKRETRKEILEMSVPLFAEFGYDGVSMRDVAAVSGLTPAALYHHFSDKEQLYLAVVEHEFRAKTAVLINDLNSPGSPWVQLENLVSTLAHLAETDEIFLRLMQWVRLDSDEARQQKLAGHVFKDLFLVVYNFAAKLDSRYDAHMLAMSIIGLVLYSLESKKIRRLMPGYRPEHDNPEVLARHVTDILHKGLQRPPTVA